MRTSIPAAVAALIVGLPVLFGAAPAAQAAAAIFVEVNPSTVQAGGQVALRASCTDNLRAATVTASPFGTVTVSPRFNFLTATVSVPAGVRAGDYRVTLHCPDGSTAATTLHVLAKVAPSRGPATGGGGTAPGRNAPMLLLSGLALLVAAAVLGVRTQRRRRVG